MAKQTMSRKKFKERARKRRQRQRRMVALAIAAGGLLLIAAGWFIWAGWNAGNTALDYTAEDIVYGEPLHAIHEMEPPSLSSIPFLPEDGPQPKIVIPETSYNFGIVGATDVVQKEFVIANVGEAPLTISRAYTTCGCTTADFTATVIPPGKVVIMTVTFDAGYHDVRGQTVRRGVIIENNDPRNPQMEVWTQATVRAGP